MYTLMLLLSPLIVFFLALIVYQRSDKLMKSGFQLIKISVKYALICSFITIAYSYFALSVRDNISIAQINYESIMTLLFLSPPGFAFGQLIALIKWKFFK